MLVGRERNKILKKKREEKIEQNKTRKATLQGAMMMVCHKQINIINSAKP